MKKDTQLTVYRSINGVDNKKRNIWDRAGVSVLLVNFLIITQSTYVYRKLS